MLGWLYGCLCKNGILSPLLGTHERYESPWSVCCLFLKGPLNPKQCVCAILPEGPPKP